MLRHGLRRNRDWTNFRSKSTWNPQSEAQKSRYVTKKPGPNSPSNMRPDFLQSLKVQTNPLSQAGTKSGERLESSKLVNLLRQGPNPNSSNQASGRPQISEPFPKPQSANPSNLQGSTNKNARATTPGLVDFFQKRLQQARENRSKNKNGDHMRTEDTKYGSPSSLRGRGQQGPQSPTSRPRQAAGMQAALKEARIAHRNQETKSTMLGELSTIRQVLDRSGATGMAQPSERKAVNPEETMSPIRQYVADLQRKNRQKREEQQSEHIETPVPSWRKSARSFSQPQRMQRQEAGASPIPTQKTLNPQQEKWEQERMLKEREKQMPPRVVKAVEVVLPSNDMTISDLSLLLRKKVTDIMACLENMGETPADSSYVIDVDMAEMVAMEMKVKYSRPKRRQKMNTDHEQLMQRRKSTIETDEETTATQSTKYESLPTRPPVVCIMGHVDHGKTTLMDSFRRRSNSTGEKKKPKKPKKSSKKSKAAQGGDVAGTESGGITQQITAFQVPLGEQNDAITFLDTPGHAAFSAMRQSGSHAADIIVLVVAADDGVSPQTIEILNFYKSIVKDSDGGISMVVAMNKIDKPGIDVEDRKREIENQLLEHGIVPEGMSSDSEYGSPVQFFPVSAKTGEGLDDLIEGLVLQSEIMDLRADDRARAEGIVMDARVEQGLGVVADCIVRWGCIQKGDVIVSDTSPGKVRILKDINDKQIKKGSPSQPVRIVGFGTAPKAGDPIVCVATEQVADDLVQRRLAMKNTDLPVSDDSSSPYSQVIISGRESMTSFGTERRLQRYELTMEDTGPIRIPIVVKAKADGSVAAVRDALKVLGEESSFDINVDPIAEGVGMLTLGEIEMAKESNAAVFSFDIRNQDKAVMALAESEGVAVHEFDVIYSLLDHAKEVFTEYLPPVQFETVHGKATVQAVFSINNDKGSVAGLRVLDGHLYKSMVDGDKSIPVSFRILRDGERISPEAEPVRATSLKKFKEDVDSVRSGEECGLSLSGSINFQEGDVIECYSLDVRKTFAQ